MYKNSLGQAIGFPTEHWQACEHPRGSRMQGRLCTVEPIDPDHHSTDLYDAFSRDRDHRNWTYLPYGPFTSLADFQNWIKLASEIKVICLFICDCGYGCSLRSNKNKRHSIYKLA